MPEDRSIAFERAYRTALRAHVNATKGPDGRAGDRIGRRAVSLGVAALGLARIHDRAAAAVTPLGKRTPASTAREESFFGEAVAPIEEAQSGGIAARAECARLAELLDRRTRERDAARARLARDAERQKVLRVELRARNRDHRELRERSRLMTLRLRRLSHRILYLQEEERKRISRDLHDAIGATLTGINVGLEALKKEATANARSVDEAIAETQELVKHSMKTVHQFAWELRPTALDDLGLVPALRSLVRAFSERTGLNVRFTADGELDRLDGDRTTAIYRVTQGALRNVECHAKAEHVRLILRSLTGVVRLEVKDDGRSFDVRRIETSQSSRHLGLLVMRERVEMVDGTFSVESSPGRGTTVRADIPLGAATHG